MLEKFIAYGRAWFSRIQSRRKRSHKWRQNATKKRLKNLQAIVGKDEAETFAKRIGYLRKIDPLLFEEWVLDAFAKQGYLVERGTRYSGDGGLDGKVFRDNRWFGIQCKRYKDAIKTAHLDDFARTLQENQMAEGFFVHTGRTPAGSRQRHANIRIISGQDLIQILLKD